ncbi:MAG: pyrroline-5-carboxylate reductase [Nitrospira sp.]|nr:pyrroline-5-carboxylate reductase [Nitrospira sp.]
MSSLMSDRNVAFVGGGRMAEALIGGLVSAGLCGPDRIRAADPDADRRERLKRQFGIQVHESNREPVAWGDLVVLAVKPQVAGNVLRDLAGALADSLVISVVAGLSIGRILDFCGPRTRVIRAMPNAPALVREGMTALAFGPGVQERDADLARRLFEAVGRVVSIEERLMDAVTGLSGSGPGYVFLVIEALTDGGVKMGVPRDVAGLLAAQTVLGAARMALETKEHPASLKDRVASPGGTTIVGLHCLERAGVRAALTDAVEAAAKRSQELGG